MTRGFGRTVIRWSAWAGLLLVCVRGSDARAQTDLPDFITNPTTNVARSVSGQFIVHGDPSRRARVSDLADNPDYLKLEPALAAVSCERLKLALADTLGDRSPWRGKIHLTQYPARSADDVATIVAEKYRNGWAYWLEMPNPIERTRFARAVIHALLAERAGRNAKAHAPDVPAWLADGLSQQVVGSRGLEFILAPPPTVSSGLRVGRMSVDLTDSPTARGPNTRTLNPLLKAQKILRTHPPLTLEELSWPTEQQLSGDDGGAFRSSAQLFVAELLRLEDGRACLRAMLDELGDCYNWQTAFFRAFRPHFERQVDLEKWWALQVVHFTGRDPAQTWSREESWNKLDELLRTPVDVRHAAEELPGRAEISLATVIREWQFIRQSQTLRAKLRELDLLRLRVAQDAVGLVDDYRRLLSFYLDRRDRAGLVQSGSKMPAAGANSVVRETLRELAELEARREELRPKPEPVAAASTEPAPQSP